VVGLTGLPLPSMLREEPATAAGSRFRCNPEQAIQKMAVRLLVSLWCRSSPASSAILDALGQNAPIGWLLSASPTNKLPSAIRSPSFANLKYEHKRRSLLKTVARLCAYTNIHLRRVQ
jgi:hypothetical protein